MLNAAITHNASQARVTICRPQINCYCYNEGGLFIYFGSFVGVAESMTPTCGLTTCIFFSTPRDVKVIF